MKNEVITEVKEKRKARVRPTVEMLQIVKNIHLRNIHAKEISTNVNLSVPTIYKIIANLEEHDGYFT